MTTALTSCGFVTPQLKEAWELEPAANRQISFGIKRRVYCELKDAVIKANHDVRFAKSPDGVKNFVPYYTIPLEWGARLSLVLTIDEKGSFAPGVTLTKQLENALTAVSNAEKPIVSGQSFTIGLGGEASSTATRIEKFEAFYTIAELNRDFQDNSVCHQKNYKKVWDNPSISSPLIVSELGLEQWLKDALFTSRNLQSVDPSKSGGGIVPDTFSIQLKFVVLTNANINPSWKLVRVASNTGGSPLFFGGRTRTHDLLITIGPPTKETGETHLASQIGQSVNANARIFSQP